MACMLSTAVAKEPKSAQLGEIYNRNAQYHGPGRNPVIVIPGILGSNLKDEESGRVVWGGFLRNYANPSRPDGARLVALPMERGVPLSQLRDRVVPNGALEQLKVSLLGVPVSLNAYREILLSLGVGGFRDENLGKSGAVNYGPGHFTCFQFAYDWRRDNAENARLLHEFILDRRKYVQSELAKQFGAQNVDVHFDIVAHSMGGLITRYYLEYGAQPLPEDGSLPRLNWAGARYVDRAVLVSTPNAGSVISLQQLLDGVQFASFLPKYQPAVLGTMPSIYQLLPRARHGAVIDERTGKAVDFLDAKFWEQNQWGLANPAQDGFLQMLLPGVADPAARREIALDHLRKSLKRAKQFHAAMDVPATPPHGTSLYLMTGDAHVTSSVATVGAGGKIRITNWGPGDATVLRSSALMDERLDGKWTPQLRSPIPWTQTNFYFKDHIGVTKDATFTDNLLFILLEQNRR